MYEAGFFDGGLHPTDPELRVRDLEQDGVDAEVVYGILAAGSLITDHDLRNFVYETYNTWAADFRRASPDRLAPLACIPNTDPQVAATELRRSAGLGLRGGELAVSTAVLPIWDGRGTHFGPPPTNVRCPSPSTPPGFR
jgi:predicted TIM-barrel fold metal-dependent hydrolase